MVKYRIIWAAYVARMRQREKVHTGFWWGELRERDHLKDVGVDGRIILKWVLKISVLKNRLD
jgi:hypothetical protein